MDYIIIAFVILYGTYLLGMVTSKLLRGGRFSLPSLFAESMDDMEDGGW